MSVQMPLMLSSIPFQIWQVKKGSCIHKEVTERTEWIAGTEFTRGDGAVAVKVSK